MTADSPPELIKLLAHELRWRIVKALTLGDYRVNELVTLIDQPLNLVSYHLKKLRDDHLVTARRSQADGRDTYYSLDLDRLRDMYRMAGLALHPALVSPPVTGTADSVPLAALPHVLFVCTHNSARSQMAEGLMRHLSQGRISVTSAGSEPTTIHPDAIRTMADLGIDIRGQQPKSFHDLQAQPFDVVITVCDQAREVCPTFPGDGQQIHWGFPDPVVIEDDAERMAAFHQIAARLRSRIDYFMITLSIN